MDPLFQCANQWEALLDLEYQFTLGRKGKETCFTLSFSPWDFHHLMGLNKLDDLRLAKENREKVFQRILRGEITYDTLAKSRNFSQIQDRFLPFAEIVSLLNSNDLIFKFHGKPSSRIEAKFLLVSPFADTEVYLFVDQRKAETAHYCRSFFPKSTSDYSVGQPKFALLRKEKITLFTGQREVLFDKKKTPSCP